RVPDGVRAERAGELGARARRSCEGRGVGQDEDGVSVELADGTRLRSRWLVGCDGGRSLVRRLLGIGFPGEPAKTEWLLGEVEVTASPDEGAEGSDEVRKTHKGFGIGPAGNGLERAVVPAATVAGGRRGRRMGRPRGGGRSPGRSCVRTGAPTSASIHRAGCLVSATPPGLPNDIEWAGFSSPATRPTSPRRWVGRV